MADAPVLREENITRAPLVKKITGLLVPRNDEEVCGFAFSALEKEWGAPERVSPRFPFDWTDYYRDISPALDRIFFSYAGLFEESSLADWKLFARRVEAKTGVARRVNIDPGCVDGAKVLLASTKGQAQRVYLRRGIFCEVTMCRRKNSWEKFFYTFPDFKSGVYDEWFETVRQDWKNDVRKLNKTKRQKEAEQ